MPSRTVFPFGDGDPEVDRSGSIGCVSGTISTKNQGPQCQFDGGTTIVGQDISFSLDANYHKGAAPSDMESGMKRQIVNDSTKKGMRTADDIRVGTLRTHNDGKGFREVKGDLAPTLPARAREDGSGQAVIAISVQTPERKKKSQNGRQVKEDGDPSFAVTAQEQPGIYDGDRLRRLTEIECERLQGFEDNWTEYGRFPDGKIKKISATQRYKTTGNAVTTTVIRAIMYRMLTIKCCDEEL
jgi:site-specific DNA-cytosine methylase